MIDAKKTTTGFVLAMVVAVGTVIAMATSLFPLPDAAKIVVAMMVAGLLPLIAYNRSHNASVGGNWVLLVLWLFLTVMCILQLELWCLTPSYSFDSPDLKNDAGGYFNWALYHYDGRGIEPKRMVFKGFPLAMTGLFKILGPSVLWPLAMNLSLTLLAVVTSGQITWRLLHPVVRNNGSFLSTLGMALTGTLMFFLSQGIAIQKEAFIYLAVALVAYVLAGMAKQNTDADKLGGRDLVLFTLGCVIMGMVRTTYLYYVFAGLLIVSIPHLRILWKKTSILMAIALAMFALGNLYALYSVEQHLVIFQGEGAMSKVFLKGAAPTQPYFNLLGPYFSYSIPHRLALLPLTSATQFAIPFPWTYKQLDCLVLFPRMAWGWYVVGGIALFYYLFVSWRRQYSLGAWPWIPVVLFAGIAYIIGGSVNRYVLPIEPLFVPVAVYVVCRLREGLWRKPFVVWAFVFVAVMAVGLTLSYHAQIDYFNLLDSYYRSLLNK